jgi:hypothetical protein
VEWAALIISIISLVIVTAFAIRQERWRRQMLALQRRTVEYDEHGWPRWRRRPPPSADE